jgi:hypothetical protein
LVRRRLLHGRKYQHVLSWELCGVLNVRREGPWPQAPAGPVQVAVGSLISHEHTTSGTVRLLRQPNGDRLLTLEHLDTSNGPDVHVWLSAADVVEGTGGWFVAGAADHYDLGVIKGNQGNQVHAIPAGVDLKSTTPSICGACNSACHSERPS